MNNVIMLDELAELDKLDLKERLGGQVTHDFHQFEVKKNEVNKEIIKLQQTMKNVVTTKKDRYIDLKFFEFTKVVLVEDSQTLLKLELLGAESPITFTCDVTENAKADLKMFLSTECPEPNEKKHQRVVERMKVFKFHAQNKKRFFENDDICYIMMHSFVGCTLKITGTSTKIRALAEPEKVKEFNKAMTKTELAQEENVARRKEIYVQELEEKYDEILKEYMKTEEEKKDLKKLNKETAGVFSTQKEIQIEMGKHRRELLSKVATLYK